MTTLYGCTKTSVSLRDAIAQSANYLNEAIGLFYSPHWCKFGKIHKDNNVVKVLDSSGEMSLDFVFEARIFNETAELRWLKSENEGKAVLLSDLSQLKVLDWQSLTPLANLETLTQTYLLWGKGIENQPQNFLTGWSRLAEARIGKLDVPILGISHLDNVQLVAREYLGKLDEYGNVAVVEERLVGLRKQVILTGGKSDGGTY